MAKCSFCGGEYAPTKRKSARCLPCKREYDKAWRARRKSEGRPVRSSPVPEGYHSAYSAAYKDRPGVRVRKAAQMRGYARNPILARRMAARRAVREALKRGTLSRGPCRDCGALNVEGHHPDYSKPLEVIWLCRIHHRAEHAKAEGRV